MVLPIHLGIAHTCVKYIEQPVYCVSDVISQSQKPCYDLVKGNVSRGVAMSSNQRQTPVLFTPEDLRKIQGQSMDVRWESVLQLAMNGEIEQACLLASDLLSGSVHLLLPPETLDKQIDLEIIDGIIGTLNNIALANDHMGEAMLKLYCHAVDMGFYSYAYNAANGLLPQRITNELNPISKSALPLRRILQQRPLH